MTSRGRRSQRARQARETRELLQLLTHVIGLEIAMSRRQIRVGRESFFQAVHLISKALERAQRGHK